MALNDPRTSIENLIGSEVPNGTQSIPSDNFQSASERRLGNLPPGAIPSTDLNFVEANWKSKQDLDWRVKLSLPSNFKRSELLTPLLETDGMVFPYTPQIVLEHQANYNSLHPTHSNYPFPAYQNSQVSSMNIIGEFLIENATEAAYWVAAVHYLRSVTKMAYGKTSNQGSPPPVVKLNGYGDYVFNNIPVTVTYFSVDLPSDVDYMQVDIGPKGTWVPTRSQINVTVQPTYSRKSITKFSLDKFINGEYVTNKKGFV